MKLKIKKCKTKEIIVSRTFYGLLWQFSVDSGALAREARKRSTMGKKMK